MNAPARIKPTEFRKMLEQMKSRFDDILPKFLESDRMIRIIMSEFNSNPKLAECEPMTIINAAMCAARLGIEVGSALGQGYLIPYGKTCQFMLGYRGMIDMVRRSGNIQSLSAHQVHANDEFQFELGLNETLRHIPAHTNRGELLGAYAIAKFKDGGHQIMYMTNEQITKARDESKMKNSLPWTKFPEEMYRKTVIRNLFKYLPVSVEMRDLIIKDSEADEGTQDNSDIIDIPPEPKKSRAEMLIEHGADNQGDNG
jgi:recombination protein RecT